MCGSATQIRLRAPSAQPWFFRASEMDPAGHINNSHYWAPLEEELASGPEPEAIDAEIEYRDPALAGRGGSPPGRLVDAGSRAPTGAMHASIVRA